MIACPFCNSIRLLPPKVEWTNYVMCFRCGATGPDDDLDASKWNKRSVWILQGWTACYDHYICGIFASREAAEQKKKILDDMIAKFERQSSGDEEGSEYDTVVEYQKLVPNCGYITVRTTHEIHTGELT